MRVWAEAEDLGLFIRQQAGTHSRELQSVEILTTNKGPLRAGGEGGNRK